MKRNILFGTLVLTFLTQVAFAASEVADSNLEDIARNSNGFDYTAVTVLRSSGNKKADGTFPVRVLIQRYKSITEVNNNKVQEIGRASIEISINTTAKANVEGLNWYFRSGGGMSCDSILFGKQNSGAEIQNFSNHRLLDIFQEYKGSSGGLGLLVGGVDWSRGSNPLGIKLSTWGMTHVHPDVGGFSVGIRDQSFEVQIQEPNATDPVGLQYTVEYYNEIQKSLGGKRSETKDYRSLSDLKL